MKRFIQWTALTALVISLGSCGLPGAVLRTAGNTVTATNNFVTTGSFNANGNTVSGSGSVTSGSGSSVAGNGTVTLSP